MRLGLGKRRGLIMVLWTLLGCGSPRPGAPQSSATAASVPRFAPPATVSACAPDRLSVLETPIAAGAPYSPSEWLPIEYALDHHSYATEELVILLVPEVDYRENVVAILALRFDVAAGRWLDDARHELKQPRGLAPRYAGLESGLLGTEYVMAWEDLVLRSKRGLIFNATSGSFREAAAAEVAHVPPYNGMFRHPDYSQGPEPTTGVSVKVEYVRQKATFSRGQTVLGSVSFPTIPGAYIGAFPATRTAFFWDSVKRSERARLPPNQKRLSYLVHLETGATCRVERDLVYPASAVLRRQGFIAFVNAHRNEVAASDCPPGAPCVAPEQSHFQRASLVIFRDRG